jgi:hypothetical protein
MIPSAYLGPGLTVLSDAIVAMMALMVVASVLLWLARRATW